MSAAPRVCLATSTHIAHNPRLVKEADALAAAGYAVRVVSVQLLPAIAVRDAGLAAGRPWGHDPVALLPLGARGRLRERATYARVQLYRRVLARATLRLGVAERAFGRAHPELAARIGRAPAELIIAHNLDALPAAAAAARRLGARLGFDAEDLHTEMEGAGARRKAGHRLLAHLEAAHIGRCDYVSAPSAGVADELARRYGIPRPLVIHNVFPWGDRAALDGRTRDRRGPALSLYWYSQVVSLQRGIGDAIRALALLDEPAQLHLRGLVGAGERERILALARGLGVAGQVHLHATVPPGELLARAAEHDVGLALEPGLAHSLNNALTVSNKFFLYPLAGLAVAASDTPGQNAMLRQAPAIGALYPPGDHRALALILRGWQRDPGALAAARRAALATAHERWSWEREQGLLLDRVAALVGAPHETGRHRRV